MFPGPQGDDRCDVHEDEDEPGGRERRVDAERLHRRVDGEQLHQPAEALEQDRACERHRRLQHRQPLPAHADEILDRADALAQRPVVAARPEPRDGEEGESDERRDSEGDDRPVGNLGRQQDPDHEDRGRNEVEEAMDEHRSYERRARPARASGRCRRSVATRASSPSRPGTTAFARRPTPKDESTWTSRG